MNKGLFSNCGNKRFESGEVVYSVAKPANGFIPLDGTNKKWFTRGVDKNFSSTLASAGYIGWTQQTFPFASTAINTIAYGNGLWVIGGQDGELRTSTDAVTWVTRTSNFGTTAINRIAYGNSLWASVGDAGQIRTSTDGITWVTRTSNFGATNIECLAYGNNLWVAGGGAGQIRTSTDAITWVTRTSNWQGATGSDVVFDVRYANNTWLAVGSWRSTVPLRTETQVRASTDAITWVTRTPGASNVIGTFRSLDYGNDVWIVSGSGDGLYVSTDTITWTTRYVASLVGSTAVKFANGLWTAGTSSGLIYSSTDGIKWKQTNSPTDTSQINSIACDNGIRLSGSNNGKLLKSNNTYTYVPSVVHGWIMP